MIHLKKYETNQGKFLPWYRRLLKDLETTCRLYCPCNAGLPKERCSIYETSSGWLCCPGAFNQPEKLPASCWDWAYMLQWFKEDLETFILEQEETWKTGYPIYFLQQPRKAKRRPYITSE